MQPHGGNAPLLAAVHAIKDAVQRSRIQMARVANRSILSLYYGIGQYISENLAVASWGDNKLSQLSELLQQELPGVRGFSMANLKRMQQFYETWSKDIALGISLFSAPVPIGLRASREPAEDTEEDCEGVKNGTIHSTAISEIARASEDKDGDVKPATIHSTTTIESTEAEARASPYIKLDSLQRTQLPPDTLSDFLSVPFSLHYLIQSKSRPLSERLYYIHQVATEFWTLERLRRNLRDDVYHHQGTAPNNFRRTIGDERLQQIAINALRDSYMLDFIQSDDADELDERRVENEIVRNIKRFVMALGADFSFMGNQYRLEVDGQEYFVDLLFYHRRLRCLVAIELKYGDFKPEYAGKMNFYLSALDDLVRLPDEHPSIVLILCRGVTSRTIEYTLRDMSKPMGLSTYRTAADLPAEYSASLSELEGLKELL